MVRWLAVIAICVNAVLLAWLMTWNAWAAPDWALFTIVPLSHPYDPVVIPPDIPNMWRYSPVALWIIQPLAIGVGQAGFVVLHFALLLLLPRRTAVIVAISFPFWVDLIFGNVFTAVFVAAFWAVRGNRVAVIVFGVLTLLMPRPVQVPMLLWLVWRQPWFRLPFVALFVGHVLLVVWSDHTVEWVQRLATDPSDITAWFNASPSRVLGYGWLLLGIPLGLWLLRHDRPLWAGLAMSPYLLPQYWMLALGERLGFDEREVALVQALRLPRRSPSQRITPA